MAGPFDVVGRWGGDELLMLTAATDNGELRALAERLCGLVRRCRLQAAGQTLSLAISVGATLASPADTPESLIGRLDRLMYRSKELGRDRVTDDLPG